LHVFQHPSCHQKRDNSLCPSRSKGRIKLGCWVTVNGAGTVEIASDDPAIHFGIISDARVILGCFFLALFYKPGDLRLYELREVAIL
jgi:hypothetical protein